MARQEQDLLGILDVPNDAYYGVQSLRGFNNFHISGVKLEHYPYFIAGLAYVKWAAIETNCQLGLIEPSVKDAVVWACKEVIAGKYNNQFRCDMIQGGAGTITNMLINEVLANIALEKLGHKKGEYQFCDAHDVVNCAQSTNDAYPTAIKIAILKQHQQLAKTIAETINLFRQKAQQFNNDILMGRTHLQDAVPLTFGQLFGSYANGLKSELNHLDQATQLCLTINMGATAIGTGINSLPEYAQLCAQKLAQITDLAIVKADDFINATSDTSAMVAYSAALKSLALRLTKIMNDIRLYASGPTCGIYELILPECQAGSSIMPGKVNPVMPESVNQACFKVIGNDLAVDLASQAAQFQLNVMEPVMAYSIFESMTILNNSLHGFNERCLSGLQANTKAAKRKVLASIGIVTALNPYIGYDNSTVIARESFQTGKDVYNLVLEKGLLSKQQLDDILAPEKMTTPRAI